MSRIVVVSNRVPLPETGAQAGGLAVVLGGLMQRRGGLWFGWDGSVTATADTDPVRRVTDLGVDYATVGLTPQEHRGYYNGFSNGVLWPLLHTMPELVQFDRRDSVSYRAVNERLARTLAPMVRPSDLIWVHDYHLLPMAAALRAQGLRNAIGFFLHIPFPAADVLNCVPGTTELVRDMLAADLIGFQTENDLSNFAVAAELLAGAARTYGSVLMMGGRRVRLGVFPVEIDPREVAEMAGSAAHIGAIDALRRSLGDQKLIFGAERLDPTKGLLQRIAGYRRFLEARPAWRGAVTMLQIAATSRKEVSAYRSLRAALDRQTGALNTDLGEPDWLPVRLLSRGVDRSLVAAYMRHARVGLVTPLRDGMNLVAKEYVAAQDPADPGVLVLSRFAGAAQQLSRALLVNPRDPESIAEAIATALAMPLAERRERWADLWSVLEDRTPLGWGRSFLDALSRDRAFVDAERALASRPTLALMPRMERPRPVVSGPLPSDAVALPSLPPGPDFPTAGSRPLH